MVRRLFPSAALLTAALAVAACGKPPAPVVAPATPAPRAEVVVPRTDDDAERRRQQEAADAARREAERVRAVLAEMIFFDYDRADIRADAQLVLNRKVEVLRANPAMRIRIEGHADDRGSDEYNLALGMRRANAARLYLTARGITIDRIAVTSWGEERPLDPRHSEAAWSRNRRGEFLLMETTPVAAR